MLLSLLHVSDVNFSLVSFHMPYLEVNSWFEKQKQFKCIDLIYYIKRKENCITSSKYIQITSEMPET